MLSYQTLCDVEYESRVPVRVNVDHVSNGAISEGGAEHGDVVLGAAGRSEGGGNIVDRVASKSTSAWVCMQNRLNHESLQIIDLNETPEIALLHTSRQKGHLCKTELLICLCPVYL